MLTVPQRLEFAQMQCVKKEIIWDIWIRLVLDLPADDVEEWSKKKLEAKFSLNTAYFCEVLMILKLYLLQNYQLSAEYLVTFYLVKKENNFLVRCICLNFRFLWSKYKFSSFQYLHFLKYSLSWLVWWVEWIMDFETYALTNVTMFTF